MYVYDATETLILENPLVRHALVFGEGRLQNGVIVLPFAASWDSNEVLEAVWPTFEHANTVVPRHSRVMKSLVLIADPHRRFLLTGKGSVQRQGTLEMYAEDIEAAYAGIERGSHLESLPLLVDESPEAIKAYIRNVVQTLLHREVADDADLFKNGKFTSMSYWILKLYSTQAWIR